MNFHPRWKASCTARAMLWQGCCGNSEWQDQAPGQGLEVRAGHSWRLAVALTLLGAAGLSHLTVLLGRARDQHVEMPTFLQCHPHNRTTITTHAHHTHTSLHTTHTHTRLSAVECFQRLTSFKHWFQNLLANPAGFVATRFIRFLNRLVPHRPSPGGPSPRASAQIRCFLPTWF